MKPRFYVNVIDKKVKYAAEIATRLLNEGSPMLDELRAKNDWKFSSGSGEEVYQKIVNCDKIAPIFMYKPKWIWSKALGYSDGKAIYINARRIDSLEFEDLVGLLSHEWLHHGPQFSHGSNYPSKEKSLYSVNYYVSDNIRKWL